MHIGVDIGGTNLAAGLVDESGRIVQKAKCSTRPERGAQAVADDIVSLCRQVSGNEEPQSIGLGVPGLVDNEKGIIIQTCNIPFDHMPIARALGRFFSSPVHLHNDANAAAWGEYVAGAGRGVSQMVVLTLGTGLGSGFILNGQLYEGVNGAAGEMGHLVIEAGGLPCGCGQNGCWEMYVSARALVAQTREAMRLHPDSLLWQTAGTIEHVSGRTAFETARQGDPAANGVLERYFDYLSIGIIGVVNTFQPELICLGGGVGREGERLLAPLRQRLDAYPFFREVRRTRLEAAQLGNDAGIIGAALLGR